MPDEDVVLFASKCDGDRRVAFNLSWWSLCCGDSFLAPDSFTSSPTPISKSSARNTSTVSLAVVVVASEWGLWVTVSRVTIVVGLSTGRSSVEEVIREVFEAAVIFLDLGTDFEWQFTLARSGVPDAEVTALELDELVSEQTLGLRSDRVW